MIEPLSTSPFHFIPFERSSTSLFLSIHILSDKWPENSISLICMVKRCTQNKHTMGISSSFFLLFCMLLFSLYLLSNSSYRFGVASHLCESIFSSLLSSARCPHSEHTQKSFDRLASIHSVKFNDSSLGVFFSLWSHLSFLHPIRIIDIIKFEMIVRLHKRIFGAAKKAAQTPTNEWTMKPWQLKWALHAESPEKSAHNRQRDLLIGSCSHLSRQ